MGLVVLDGGDGLIEVDIGVTDKVGNALGDRLGT
jgi:hypothetical protein